MDQARGRYHGTGWTLDISADRLGPAGHLVTVHEAWHDRLQFTTSLGLIIQAFWAVHDALGKHWTQARADQLLLSASRTHEEFASWMTEQLAGALRTPLQQAYPLYARHARRASERIGALNTDYARMHAIDALYRSCMQSADAAALAAHALGDVSLATLPRGARPDYRLRTLTNALAVHGWSALPVRPDLETVQDYQEEEDGPWTEAAEAYYSHCAGLLTEAGCSTLPYEGQLAYAEELHTQGNAIAERPIDLVPSPASSHGTQSGEDLALRVLEGERVRLRAAQPCRVLAPTTAVSALAAGRGSRRHLFLAIRPAGRLKMLYQPAPQMPPARGHVAHLRGSGVREYPTINLLDVTDRTGAELIGTELPLMTSISLSSLNDDATRSRWAPLLSTTASTVLVDSSPSEHLRRWVTGAGHVVRYGVADYRAAERLVTVLIWQLEMAGGVRSPLHLTPTSQAFATALSVWIAARPELSASILRDESVLDAHADLLAVTMGHLLAEEGSYDFRGEQPT